VKLSIVKYVLLYTLFSFGVIVGQPKDAASILEKVKSVFSVVKDYRAALHIKVDVDFLKVPEGDAEILFKAPNKFKFNSEGFALLPKQGLHFSPTQLFNVQYTSFVEREERYQNHDCTVIKVIPMGDAKEVVLQSVWVDKERFIIRKVESVTRTGGTFSIFLNYSDPNIFSYPLPESMAFSFDISKMNLPKGVTGDVPEERHSRRRNALTKGKVVITYSNYRVNGGIADELFKEKK
jgi:outer membrane lipoprotein-sorting protein